MYAVRAIYDGVNFTPTQPISVKGWHEVVITFLEPVAEGEVLHMGMTNEQFDSYKTSVLRNLERAVKEVAESKGKSETLEQVVNDLKSELKKP